MVFAASASVVPDLWVAEIRSVEEMIDWRGFASKVRTSCWPFYGSVFAQRVEGMGIKQKLISPRSPWQNPYVERLIGSIRRECLNRVIVLNERHLRQILEQFLAYYHEVRPHRSLAHDSPIPRAVQLPDRGKVIEIPLVGGLHHQYLRQAA